MFCNYALFSLDKMQNIINTQKFEIWGQSFLKVKLFVLYA